MKWKFAVVIVALSLGVFVFNGSAHAYEKGSKGSHKGSMMDGEVTGKVTESGAIKVGNTICPLSQEKVGGMGDVVEYEHDGKVYNFCCKMCLKGFKKDPAKYIKIINESMVDEKSGESHSGHDH